MSRNENPIPKLIPKLVNLIITALFVYTCWYTWQLYKVYENGYEQGLRSGAFLRQQAVQNTWKAQKFLQEKTDFTKQYGPKSTKTWRDQLFQQGWSMGLDKAVEDIH